MTEAPDRPGALASALDGVVVLSAGMALILGVTGPYRDVVFGRPVSLGWMHAAFAGVAAAAIRHAAQPRPTLLASIWWWRDGLRRRPALGDALLAFWLTRPAIVAVGLIATVTIGFAPAAKDAALPRQPASTLPARWDAQWYAGLAAHGYEWQHSFDPQQNLAFFPAYPLLIRALGGATGAFRPGLPADRQIARLAWCGLAISLAAFFWAAWYFSRLAREMMDARRARTALLLLAAYPFALFFSAAYTESLFLLAALGTWFHFRRGDTWATAGWGMLAGLTRPNGCFLSIPLGLLALGLGDAPGAAPPKGGLARRLALAAMPGVGMLLFTVYVHQLTGIWFAWSKTHAAWGRVVGSTSLTSVFDRVTELGMVGFVASHPYDLLNAIGLLFALALVRGTWRLSPAWAAFVLVNVLVPLSAGGLLSMGRLTSTLFPLFLACGAALPAAWAAVLTAGFGVAQILLAALFYTWRDVY